MDSKRVKESLETAILLSKVTHSLHNLNLDGIGKVEIDKHYVALFAETGEKKILTQENLEEHIDELMGESLEQSIKKRLPELCFD